MKRFAVLIVIIVLTISMFTTVTYAAIPSGVGSWLLGGTYVVQNKSNWCWAASAENAIIWEQSPTRTQWDAVRHIKGSLLDPYPNEGGTIFESRDAAEYISKNTLDYSAIEKRLTYAFLCEQIYNSHPVIVGAGYYSGDVRNGGHATLVIGWNDASDINYLTYYDPATDTRETCTYYAFYTGSYNGRCYDQTCYVVGS